MTDKGTSDAMPAGTRSGTPQVLLGHHLKQLKLPTVLREYDKVARECARDGVDHPRYLLRLVELELIDRERRMVERRIRQARFTGALLDRLTHHVHILTMNGDSYRFKQSAGRRRAATAADAAEQNQATAEPGDQPDTLPVGPESV